MAVVDVRVKPEGIMLHETILKINTITGAIRKIVALARVGIRSSLNISLAPSAKGCNKPQKPTTFGPFRRWIAAITFRSAIVKYATAIKIQTIFKREEIKIWLIEKEIKFQIFPDQCNTDSVTLQRWGVELNEHKTKLNPIGIFFSFFFSKVMLVIIKVGGLIHIKENKKNNNSNVEPMHR
jgi:hypothetical protein